MLVYSAIIPKQQNSVLATWPPSFSHTHIKNSGPVSQLKPLCGTTPMLA